MFLVVLHFDKFVQNQYTQILGLAYGEGFKLGHVLRLAECRGKFKKIL